MTSLRDRMGVQLVENHAKYLGLPTITGKSKNEVFWRIQDRVVNKIREWKERTLSKAGKEVLLKAAIQSMPTYVMSCFLLPTKLNLIATGGMYKDGSLGFGFVVRDADGEALIAGATRKKMVCSSTVAEALALRWANEINGKGIGDIQAELLFEDIKDLSHGLGDTTFSHV
ncbi:conserved hypothetical protein [Ricinus communis]|uniref:RNase H type-1 domain-containing protein n=1 Tax=Ricinus communis TaxID=3988 RepID=B9T3M1_RICCO|nr:conserved hypothetical protein [Ricinus communis]